MNSIEGTCNLPENKWHTDENKIFGRLIKGQ